jgi:hypothetical protein
MKTIITTICLAIILQFSAHTSVYADTATMCAGEKWRAQNQGIPMSEKCKRNAAYGESSNLLPKILLGIVVLVIGIPLFAFLFAGIETIKEKSTARIARKEWEKSEAGQKSIKAQKKSAEKYRREEEIRWKEVTKINEELETITGKDFKGSKKEVPSTHPIDVSIDSDGNKIAYMNSFQINAIYPEQALVKDGYKVAPTVSTSGANMEVLGMYFIRRTFKYSKPKLITIADYYKVEYDEKDSIKTIQEKIYDALEIELSSGRFKDCLRHVVVWSFCTMQIYYVQYKKEQFGTLEIAAFEKAAYQKKQIFPDQCQKFINST